MEIASPGGLSFAAVFAAAPAVSGTASLATAAASDCGLDFAPGLAGGCGATGAPASFVATASSVTGGKRSTSAGPSAGNAVSLLAAVGSPLASTFATAGRGADAKIAGTGNRGGDGDGATGRATGTPSFWPGTTPSVVATTAGTVPKRTGRWTG
ncbi:MAG: hypothetical protein ACLQLG_07740 [Thermoguttaceae bacterium]